MKSADITCEVPKICGTTVLGERGQIVIPKTLRDSLQLKKGDSFVIMNHGSSVILIPTSEMKELLSKATSMIGTISKTL